MYGAKYAVKVFEDHKKMASEGWRGEKEVVYKGMGGVDTLELV